MIRDAIGAISAGTLGYISNGVRGAKSAIRGYKSYSKSMKRSAATNYSSVKRRKYNNKKKNLKKRPRKSSLKGCSKKDLLNRCAKKQVRNIALKVVHGESPAAVYDKRVIWNFPQVVGSPSVPLQNVVNALLFGSTVSTHNGKLCVGTSLKIIDAISILFSNKGASREYTATDNLATAQMIIPEVYHSADVVFRNNTPMEQCFLIYETTPKEDTNSDVYTQWNAMSAIQKGGTTRGITYFGNRPEFYAQFKDAYRILKKKMFVVKPGQCFEYKFSTSAKHLSFDKWNATGSTGTPLYYRKGFTKELLVINWAKLVCGQTASGFMGGAWDAGGDSTYVGVGVEMTEHYKVRCPENVDNTNIKDNTFALYSEIAAILNNGANTITTPAISYPTIYQ